MRRYPKTPLGYDGCEVNRDEHSYMHGGITAREFYAAMALQGLLANPARYEYIARRVALSPNDPEHLTQEQASTKNAKKAVMLADALLRALHG